MNNESISQTTATSAKLFSQSVSKPQAPRQVEEAAQQDLAANKASSSRPDTAQISAQARALAASEGGASSNDANNRQQRVDERRQPDRQQAAQQGQQVQQQRLDIVA